MLKIMGLASQTASDFRVSAKEGATWIGLPSLSAEILGDRLVVKTEQMQSWAEGPLGVDSGPSPRHTEGGGLRRLGIFPRLPGGGRHPWLPLKASRKKEP